MLPSIQIPQNRRVRAALLLREVQVNVRSVSRKFGANEKTVHAVLAGTRPGKDKKVKAAVAELLRLANGGKQ